jgi:hypothetical protein
MRQQQFSARTSLLPLIKLASAQLIVHHLVY